MGHRTYIGIAKQGSSKVQFAYGHWAAPLHRAGAAILMGELDESYEYQGEMLSSEFEPDLHIECAYLLQGGVWMYAETGKRWKDLTKEDVDASFRNELRVYKAIATGTFVNAEGRRYPAQTDYWRYYDYLQIAHSRFMSSELTPLDSFSGLEGFVHESIEIITD